MRNDFDKKQFLNWSVQETSRVRKICCTVSRRAKSRSRNRRCRETSRNCVPAAQSRRRVRSRNWRATSGVVHQRFLLRRIVKEFVTGIDTAQNIVVGENGFRKMHRRFHKLWTKRICRKRSEPSPVKTRFSICGPVGERRKGSWRVVTARPASRSKRWWIRF